MDYRSFIRALKFQNRTRPSADGLLCRQRYQNSFWRLVLLQSVGIVQRFGGDGDVSGYLQPLSLPCEADKGQISTRDSLM